MRRVITSGDPVWPSQLEELGRGVPKDLHIEGGDLPSMERAIAIVGTRLASSAGLALASSFAKRFAEAGYVVVSGMARGIDTAAHRGALDAGGSTVAVMGCGLDLTYPRRNEGLRTQIAETGSLVSEYADDVPPNAFHFPQRNRIVAGLSLGVVVIEGGLKSGALITARQALDLDRDVWAVPGTPGDPRGEGANQLIRSGEAGLVTHPDQVFEEIAPQLAWTEEYSAGLKDSPQVTGEEFEVLRSLSAVPVTPDQLHRELDLPGGRIALALTKLEVRGLASSIRGGAYRLSDSGARALGVEMAKQR